ncbi:MAG: ECF transporter S component [Candidatus Altiarchaeota archaeon]
MNKAKLFAWLSLILVTVALVSGFKASWLIYTSAIAALATLLVLSEFDERSRDPRTVALTGVIVALAATSRQLLHGIEFSPVFFIVILAGHVFGFTTGFAVGALTMFVSNFFIGQGPWTAYQMLGMGLLAGFAAYLPRNDRFRIRALTAYSIVTAFLYGAFTDVFFWLAFIPTHEMESLLAVFGAGLLPALSRAMGNLFFMSLLGPVLLKVLLRFRKRLTYTYHGKRQ